jgi:hypothetical protein
MCAKVPSQATVSHPSERRTMQVIRLLLGPEMLHGAPVFTVDLCLLLSCKSIARQRQVRVPPQRTRSLGGTLWRWSFARLLGHSSTAARQMMRVGFWNSVMRQRLGARYAQHHLHHALEVAHHLHFLDDGHLQAALAKHHFSLRSADLTSSNRWFTNAVQETSMYFASEKPNCRSSESAWRIPPASLV